MLINFWNLKYNWTKNYFCRINNINLNFLNLKGKNLLFNNNIVYKKKEHDLQDLIILKKKSSMFKKYTDVKLHTFNKIYSYKNNFNDLLFDNKKDSNFYSTNKLSFSKNLDFTKSFKPFMKENRKLLKSFYNLKYYRNFSLTKNLKKYNNLNKKNLINYLENSLFSVLIKSDVFFSFKDCCWFINSGLISVNAKIIKNPNFIVKSHDIVNIAHSSYIYSFYKSNFNFLLKNFFKINSKMWSLNKINNKSNVKSYPNWIEFYKFFKKDIPVNFEVDYITMTIIILDYPLVVKNLDSYNYKFINLYLNRLYNWKFLV